MKNPFSDKMTFNELFDWAKGYILVGIGKGEFETAVSLVIQAAMQQSHMDEKR